MEANVALEAKRAKRYFVIRLISRIGDVAIYASLLLLLGIEWLIPAFVISSIFNYTVDFWGQKLWTFEEKDRRLQKLLPEFGFYILIRGGNAFGALSTWYVLHMVLGVSLVTTTIITIMVFWTISFPLYRWLYVGSIKDLPDVIRKAKDDFNKRVRSN